MTTTDKEQLISNLLIMGLYTIIQANDLTEEELVAGLASLHGQRVDKDIFLKLKDKLVIAEKYELANVIKTHISYNYKGNNQLNYEKKN